MEALLTISFGIHAALKTFRVCALSFHSFSLYENFIVQSFVSFDLKLYKEVQFFLFFATQFIYFSLWFAI